MSSDFFKFQLILLVIPLSCIGLYSMLISLNKTQAKNRIVRELQKKQLMETMNQDPIFQLLNEKAEQAKNPSLPSKSDPPNRFAYVFYIAEENCLCYALVNIHRLAYILDVTNFADIVLLVMEGLKIPETKNCENLNCFGKRLKVLRVPKPPFLKRMASKFRYSHLKFEAFKLFQYQRIILVDSDGLILRNLDHLLFMDLKGYDVAATFTNDGAPKRLLGGLLVVEPNQELYQQITNFMKPSTVNTVAQYSGGNVNDMDILNYILKSGVLARILAKEYVVLDSTLASGTKVNLTELYYVHFSHMKPHLGPESKRWMSEPNLVPSQSVFLKLFQTYWSSANSICTFLRP